MDGIVLDGESSYSFSFDMKIPAGSLAATNLCVILSENADASKGIYSDYWFSLNQIRTGAAIDGNGWPNSEYDTLVNGTIAFAEDTTYSVKYIIEKDKVTYYINDTLVKVILGTAGGYGEAEFTAIPTFADAKIGFVGQNAAPNIEITNISVKKQAASEPSEPETPSEPEGPVWSENLVADAQQSIVINSYDKQFLDGIILDGKSTYEFSFDMKIPTGSLAATNLCVILSENADATKGIYSDYWFGLNQIRTGTAIDGNGWPNNEYDTLVNGSIIFAEDTTYNVKYIIEKNKVTYYINDTLVKVILGANGGYGEAEYTEIPTFADAKVGFVGQNAAPNIEITNISVKKDTASGSDPEVPAGPVWGTENLVAGQGDINLKGAYTAVYLDAVLDKHTGYKLDYTLTFNTVVPGNWNNLSAMLRQNGSDLISFGWWADASGNGDGQLRFAENDISNGAQTAVQSATPVAGQAYNISIVIMPDYVELYVDGQIVTMYLTSGGTATQIPVSKRIANGKIGFIDQGSHPDMTISNIALYVDTNGADAPAIDQEAVDAVIAQINAIGTVTKDSAAAVAAARAAYDALNAEEQALVTNADTLIAAESALKLMTASQDMKLYALDGTYAIGYNHWGSMVSVSNANGGGMRFNWDNSGTNMRRAINRGVALDGLHLVASDLNLTSDNKAMAFYIADFDQNEAYSNYEPRVPYFPLAIILNFNDGTIEIGNSETTISTQVIATGDALKYENMKGIEWSLNIDANDDGTYTVTVNGVSGIIPKEILDKIKCLTQLDYEYVTICAWSNNVNHSGMVSGSVDILSLHGGGNACADDLSAEEMDAVTDLIAKIATIGTVTKDSKDVIESCEAAYAALNEVQKGCVTNYKVLAAARYRYNMLTQIVDIPCINYYQITNADTGGTNHWQTNDMLTHENAVGGGVTFKWQNGGTNVRRFIDRKVTLDGLHMVISNLDMSKGVSSFAFFFADLYDTAADWTSLYSEFVQGQATCAVMLVDPINGAITIQVGNDSIVVLRDDRLTYEFLEGATWDVKIEKRADGDYTIIANGAEGVIPASILDKATRLTDRDNEMYVTVSAWGNGVNYSYDLVAIHGGNVVCAEDLTEEMEKDLNEVIEAIFAIYDGNWQIQPSAEAAYNKAWDLYDALPVEVQALVANYSDLVVATDVLEVVLAIDNLGTITLESGDEIEEVRKLYKNLAILFEEETGGSYQRVNIDTDRRLLVGNYATLDKAIRTYYNLYKDAALNGTASGGNGDDNGDDNGDGTAPDTGDSLPYAAMLVFAVSLGVAVTVCKKSVRKES